MRFTHFSTLCFALGLLGSVSASPMPANSTDDSGTSTGGPGSASMTSADIGSAMPSATPADSSPSEIPNMTCPPPSNSTTSGDDDSAGESGSTPAFVIYTDKTKDWANLTTMLPPASEMEGYTVVALSFLLVTGATDQAAAWEELDNTTRQTFKEEYNQAGISIIVSAFGSTDLPTRADPVGTADTMAQWVLDHELDGIDVDYEDFDAMKLQNGAAEKWLVTFTQTLRKKLPNGRYILTHAPVAPWFSQQFSTSGAYLTVDTEVGSLIDWYNVQFYNQGAGMYETCDGLLNTAGSASPGSALNEIASAGVPLNKLVIGKIATPADGNDGYIDPATLAQCVAQAKQQGWSECLLFVVCLPVCLWFLVRLEDAGVMFWEYPHADGAMIKTVRGSAFPL
ncbi:glycoside hydrolase family 18 protein [Trametes sanguinea]|nr:glycoside hydrolase family 18 protein [Trametes sanguinea]